MFNIKRKLLYNKFRIHWIILFHAMLFAFLSTYIIFFFAISCIYIIITVSLLHTLFIKTIVYIYIPICILNQETESSTLENINPFCFFNIYILRIVAFWKKNSFLSMKLRYLTQYLVLFCCFFFHDIFLTHLAHRSFPEMLNRINAKNQILYCFLKIIVPEKKEFPLYDFHELINKIKRKPIFWTYLKRFCDEFCKLVTKMERIIQLITITY